MFASLERRACLVGLTSLALVAAPMLADAAPPDPAIEGPSPEHTEPDAEPTEPDAEPTEHTEPNPEPTEPAAEPTEPDAEPELTEVEVTDVERTDVPSGGGVAGAIVDPDDPNATRAQSDLEGESLDTDVAGVPERLPKLQAAGWWTTFTAVALATTGGIFAGIAEVRQDEAERLAYSFDLLTGRSTAYGPVAAEYEQLLDEGNTYQWVARGFIIAGGVALVTGIALFAVDGARRRKAGRSGNARLHLDPGLTLRF
jgi:hypothetical protein